MLVLFTIFSKDLDNLIPLTVRGLPTYKAQHWLNRIHDELKGTVMRRTPPECMAKFVGMFSSFPVLRAVAQLVER